MKTIAVLFATREGQTKKIAERVVADLRERGFRATARNVLDPAAVIDLSVCQAAILAGSVHIGHHEREMVKFVKDHLLELQRLPTTALLSVTLSQAGVERTNGLPEKRVKSAAGVQFVLNTFFKQTGWRPKHVKAVAGALQYTRYDAFVRFIMKRIAKSEGADTDTSRDYEYTDWVALDTFVDEIAMEIESLPAASGLQAKAAG